MKKILYFIIISLLIIPTFIYAEEKEINLHLFYRSDCPHCEKLQEFMREYLSENENVNLYKYEVSTSKENRERFNEVKELLDNESNGVPFLIIGNQVIVGYSQSYTNDKIETIIDYYEKNDYRDLVGEYLGITDINEDIEILNKDIISDIEVPLLGNVNPKTVSLGLVAVIIGFVDGFNPCAMWILIMLITMMLGMKDRKKMWILGLTFIFTSGFIYLLFMASWLNLATFMNKSIYIQIAIGLFACIFGIININNYLKTRKQDTGCVVVNDKKRKSIIKRAKKIFENKSFILALLGIIVLAGAVNVIELLCSLGLPVVFTEILSLNDITSIERLIYMLIYIMFFLIDDIVIFLIAMKSLKIKSISNKYTKYSHLIGGIIMLLIGLLMIFKPNWLMFNF